MGLAGGSSSSCFPVDLSVCSKKHDVGRGFAGLCRDPRLLPGLAEPLQLIVSMSFTAAKLTTALGEAEGRKGEGKGGEEREQGLVWGKRNGGTRSHALRWGQE